MSSYELRIPDHATEKTKTSQVEALYHVDKTKSPFFVPFALEVTGTFGEQARAFLPKILKRPPHPNASAEEKAAFTENHRRALSNIKSAIVTAIWRSNSCLMDSYALGVITNDEGG